MRWLLDLLYMAVSLMTAPVWLLRMVRTGKIRTDWRGRFGRTRPLPAAAGPRILLHAVSVGEINAIRLLVEELAARGDIDIVIATTTDTGHARAVSLFSRGCHVVRYPLDFSSCVERFLRAVQPDVVALVELELWPNFCAACRCRDIPVAVINGRLTERSFTRYRRIRWIIRRTFEQLNVVAVQSKAYAERFRALGVPEKRLHVTGTMKWDTAEITDEVPGALELAADMGIDSNRPLIVAGSTAPGEHELLVRAVPEDVQLLCAPRRPEWFDQAAAAMPGCARRSRGQRGSRTGRFLLDTIGELRQAYALADVAVVGRSFGNLHGSDMMEPVALGKPTVIGPAVQDFEETMHALRRGQGVVQCDLDALSDVLRDLLNDPERRRSLAANGRAVIRAHQGATHRHADLLEGLLLTCSARNSPFQRVAETAKEKKEERTW